MFELDVSFHAIPSAHLCEKWVKETPDNLLFDVKCYRALSHHVIKLKSPPTDPCSEVEATDCGNVVLTPELEEIARRFLAELKPLEYAGTCGSTDATRRPI